MKMTKSRKKTPPPATFQSLLCSANPVFKDGDVVWAKCSGYPWWPCMIFKSWDVVVKEWKIQPPIARLPFTDGKEIIVFFLDSFQFQTVSIRNSRFAGLSDDESQLLEMEKKYNIVDFVYYRDKFCDALNQKKHRKYRLRFQTALTEADELIHQGEYQMDYTSSVAIPEKRKKFVSAVDKINNESIVVGKAPSKKRAKLIKKVPEKVKVDSDSKKRIYNKRKNGTERLPNLDGSDSDDFYGGDSDGLMSLASLEKQKKYKKKKRINEDYTEIAISKNKQQFRNTPISCLPTCSSADAVIKEVQKFNQANVIIIDDSSDESERTNFKKDFVGQGRINKSTIPISGNITSTKAVKKKGRPRKIKDNSSQSSKLKPKAKMKARDPRNAPDTPLSTIWSTSDIKKSSKIWDSSIFTDNKEIESDIFTLKTVDPGEYSSLPAQSENNLNKKRRESSSVKHSAIRASLASGNLDPHTMVACEQYRGDFNVKKKQRQRAVNVNKLADEKEPFCIKMHPDVAFVCDLHAHLAECEIIGFLGGRWDPTERTLYIQAAFPCRSLDNFSSTFDGSTDVEMDPASEIALRSIISANELQVVGWYHSHPTFQPDPSIRDIENQTSYQSLFTHDHHSHHPSLDTGVKVSSNPFVGLIVGTYDTKNHSPISIFRFFHVRGEEVKGRTDNNLVYLPYELTPVIRQYHKVLQAKEHENNPFYPDVLRILGFQTKETQGDKPARRAKILLSFPCDIIPFNAIRHKKRKRNKKSNDEELSQKTLSKSPTFFQTIQRSSIERNCTMIQMVDNLETEKNKNKQECEGLQKKKEIFIEKQLSGTSDTNSRKEISVSCIPSLLVQTESTSINSGSKYKIRRGKSGMKKSITPTKRSSSSKKMDIELDYQQEITQVLQGSSPTEHPAREIDACDSGVDNRIPIEETAKIENVISDKKGLFNQTNCEFSFGKDARNLLEIESPYINNTTLCEIKDKRSNEGRTQGNELCLKEQNDDIDLNVIKEVLENTVNEVILLSQRSGIISDSNSRNHRIGANIITGLVVKVATRSSVYSHSSNSIVSVAKYTCVLNKLDQFVDKYGIDMEDLVSQSMALIDYYAVFKKKTNLREVWKHKINKKQKLQLSLAHYCQYLPLLPTKQQNPFIQDLIHYLESMWR